MSTDPKSNYYDAGGIETIDFIRAKLTNEQYEGYLLGNIMKYSSRANHKGDFDRDLEKVIVYGKLLAEINYEKQKQELFDSVNVPPAMAQPMNRQPMLDDAAPAAPAAPAVETHAVQPAVQPQRPLAEHNPPAPNHYIAGEAQDGFIDPGSDSDFHVDGGAR